MSEAGSTSAGVEQFAAVVVSEQERAHTAPSSCHGREASNHKFLPHLRFHLAPRTSPPRGIRGRNQLGNNSFRSELAGLRKHHIAVGVDVLAESQRRMWTGLREK